MLLHQWFRMGFVWVCMIGCSAAVGEGPQALRGDDVPVTEQPGARDAGAPEEAPGAPDDASETPSENGPRDAGAGAQDDSPDLDEPPSTTDCDFNAAISGCAGTCHSFTLKAGKLDLESPDLADRLVNVEAMSPCGSRKLVDPSDPAQSVFFLKLSSKDCSSTSMHLRDADTQACVLGWIKSQ